MAGGVIEAVMLQPLDVTKTRLQLSGGRMGAVAVAKNMVKNEGVLSLYKGLSPFCAHLVTKYSVRWYFNEFFRGVLADKNGDVSVFRGLLAGLGSGITEAVLIVTPFEVIKIRLQQQKGLDKSKLKYKGTLHTAKTIFQEEGARSLWKGNVPTMWRQGLNQLLLFGTYDIVKRKLYGSRDATIPVTSSMGIGLLAGALGPLCNNPIDVTKTRLMAQISVKGEAPKYTGMVQCMTTVAKEEGFSALMSGCMMRIIRVAPGMAITFATVEILW
eukprot:CAMPEP_0206182630 /NCGR_PEP_ID=MMETSP0166-20121206/173_1 /ASSEMBLY_ACC=CAM_ASM_000260 /TAXON_ID=95228 /ORGANISM="Vannella robusta, Strain DIVA3 518/3/11/1/6" /LENGTH=270 /DNA_ID=CAMNT_0053597363 /DNA_START=15 /DNA_END=824 /DNA_ORIENTATION=-